MTTFARPGKHILKRYDKDMRKLQKRVLKMGAMVADQMQRLQDALGQEDDERARRVIEGDRPIDLQEIKVDKFIIRLLARRAPVGSDLRYIVAASRIVTELERLGDETAQMAAALFQEETPVTGCNGRPAHGEVRSLVEQLLELFEQVLAAFEKYDYRSALELAGGEASRDRATSSNPITHLQTCTIG